MKQCAGISTTRKHNTLAACELITMGQPTRVPVLYSIWNTERCAYPRTRYYPSSVHHPNQPHDHHPDAFSSFRPYPTPPFTARRRFLSPVFQDEPVKLGFGSVRTAANIIGPRSSLPYTPVPTLRATTRCTITDTHIFAPFVCDRVRVSARLRDSPTGSSLSCTPLKDFMRSFVDEL